MDGGGGGGGGERKYPQYAVFLQTVQGGAIKTLFEVLKDVVYDVQLTFDRDGVRLTQTDTSCCALLHLRLHADAFEEYECPQRVQAGVQTACLFKVLKTTGSGDTVTLYLDESRDTMGLQIQNSDKNIVTDYELTLLDVPPCRMKMPEVEFDCELTLPSGLFQRLCREAKEIAGVNTLTVAFDGSSSLEISCKGDYVRQRTVLGEANDGLAIISATGTRACNDYQLKFLMFCSKACNLCNTIEMTIKHDYLLVLKYNVASLGELRFCFCPSVNADDLA